MPDQRRTSLSHKIIAITLAGLLLVFSLSAGASWLNANRFFRQSQQIITKLFQDEIILAEETIRESLEGKGQSLAGFLSEIAGLEIISFDHETLKSYLKNILKDEDVLYAVFRSDIDKSLLARHRPLTGPGGEHNHHDDEDFSPLRKQLIETGSVLDYSRDIHYSGAKVGTVYVGISQENLNKIREHNVTRLANVEVSLQSQIYLFLKKFNIILLVIYSVAFLFIGTFLYMTVKVLIINKLQRMSKIFSQVSLGDLSKKIDIDSSDEIGDVCRSFNNMTSSLEKVTVSRDNLEESNSILEQTRQYLAESHRKLEDSYEFSRKLINNSPVGIIIISDYEKIADINIAGARILGRPQQEIVVMKFQDLFPAKGRDSSFNCKEMAMRIQSEQTCVAPDGTTIPVLMNCIELKNERQEDIVLSTFVDISDRKNAEEKLRQISVTDELTGLLNRRGFMSMADKQLKIASRVGTDLFLLFADLDKLKWINDQLGHSQGDQAIMEAADILRNTFRQSDIIGRLGGDEFAVLLTAETGMQEEETIKMRLEAAVKTLNDKTGRTFSLSISCGIIRFSYQNPLSLEELMSRADALMYECKIAKKKILGA